jgi:hypothetical protein
VSRDAGVVDEDQDVAELFHQGVALSGVSHIKLPAHQPG